MQQPDAEALAKLFFDALESADVGALKALYAEDATLWTNVTQRALPALEAAAFLPILAKRMSGRTYSDRRVTGFDGGFIQRHRITGVRASDGARVAAECCAIVFVSDGRIARVEEYLDARQLEALSSK